MSTGKTLAEGRGAIGLAGKILAEVGRPVSIVGSPICFGRSLGESRTLT